MRRGSFIKNSGTKEFGITTGDNQIPDILLEALKESNVYQHAKVKVKSLVYIGRSNGRL